MKKLYCLAICVILLMTSCQTDESVTNERLNSKSRQNHEFENDIVFDSLANLELLNPHSFISKIASNGIIETLKLIDDVDTDKDGISDYAENRIDKLDKNNPNDASNLKAADVITVSKDDGTKVSIPFFQTSYYQNNFCNPPEPVYLGYQLDEREITLLGDIYYKWLKILRTPEFQNYILTKPAGVELGMKFLKDARSVTRRVEFRSMPEIKYQNTVGMSNRWNYIHISHWAMAPGNTNYLTGVPHEFIHHIGYGHEYDYAYGGGYKASTMYNQKKYDYEVINLEQKKLYKGAPTLSIQNQTNSNVVLHYAEFTDSKHIISNYNWITSAINSDKEEVFAKNTFYTLKISTLNAQNVSIWIDFNDDAEYTNNERVLVNKRCGGGWATTNLQFLIPSTATIGKHYMRINSSFYTHNPVAYYGSKYGSSFNLFATIK